MNDNAKIKSHIQFPVQKASPKDRNISSILKISLRMTQGRTIKKEKDYNFNLFGRFPIQIYFGEISIKNIFFFSLGKQFGKVNAGNLFSVLIVHEWFWCTNFIYCYYFFLLRSNRPYEYFSNGQSLRSNLERTDPRGLGLFYLKIIKFFSC